jgi:hypothetical protein
MVGFYIKKTKHIWRLAAKLKKNIGLIKSMYFF